MIHQRLGTYLPKYSVVDIDGFIPTMRDVIIWSIILIIFFEITFRTVKFVWPIFSGLYELIRDWKGVPEKPNHARVPGVMERLDKIEDGHLELTSRLDRIEKLLIKKDERDEANQNSGKSDVS